MRLNKRIYLKFLDCDTDTYAKLFALIYTYDKLLGILNFVYTFNL